MKAADRYDSLIQFYAEQSGVSWQLLKAQMLAESAANPDAALMDFLQSTYEAAAELARWDRAALERR